MQTFSKLGKQTLAFFVVILYLNYCLSHLKCRVSPLSKEVLATGRCWGNPFAVVTKGLHSFWGPRQDLMDRQKEQSMETKSPWQV